MKNEASRTKKTRKKAGGRLLGGILALCMALGLVACGGSAPSEEPDETRKEPARDPAGQPSEEAFASPDPEHVYKATQLPFDGIHADFTGIDRVAVLDGRLYFLTTVYAGSGYSVYMISMETDGSDVAETDLGIGHRDSAENGGLDLYQRVCGMATDGTNLYLAVNEYGLGEDADGEFISKDEFRVLAVDADGTERWRKEICSHDVGSGYANDLCGIAGLPEGCLISWHSGETDEFFYSAFGSDGTMTRDFSLPIGGSILSSADGRIFAVSSGTDLRPAESRIYPLYPESGTVGEEAEGTGFSGNNLTLCKTVFGGSYDFYFYNTSALYGCRTDGKGRTELLDFVDSDIDPENVSSIAVVDDDTLILTVYDKAADCWEGKTCLSILNRAAPEDAEDRIALTLACFGSASLLRPRIIAFNRESDQYRIRLLDYSIYNDYSTEEGRTLGLDRFNRDIASGQVPDILCLTEDMPVERYEAMGLFTDLYPLIDQDPDMEREDFLTNIFDAFSVNGELFRLAPEFYLRTLAGKTSVVGEEPGWSMADLLAFAGSQDDGRTLFNAMTRREVLELLLRSSCREFADRGTGECRFDSDEFVSLLKLCALFPEAYTAETMTSDGTQWRNGTVLLTPVILNRPRQYYILVYGTFGEAVTLIGFPGVPGSGAVVCADLSFAISAESENIEGAWQYVREYLMPDYQDSTGCFPVRAGSMETMLREAGQRPYCLDEDGNRVEYEDTTRIGNETIEIPPMSEDDIRKVGGVIYGAKEACSGDETLVSIVMEEADAFFSGRKSAEDTASVIQARAARYLSGNGSAENETR